MRKKLHIKVIKERTHKTPRIIFLDEKIVFDLREDWRTALKRLDAPLKAQMNRLLSTDEEKSNLAEEYLDDTFMSKYFLTLEVDTEKMSVDKFTSLFPLF